MKLVGKTVIITGGSSGIGRESALLLAREGANIAVADVNVEGGEETDQMILDGGWRGYFHPKG